MTNSYEQISLFEVENQIKDINSLREVVCKFQRPLRPYFCEDGWFAEECKGCPNYKEHDVFEHLRPEEDALIKYADYLSFKCWLYYNFPMFNDNEIDTDVWEYKTTKVKLTTYDRLNEDGSENHDQFANVSYQLKTSGGGLPCDTYAELRDALNYALNFKG